MAQVTGIVKIYLNGDLQASEEGAKMNMGGVERTAVMGPNGLLGYKQKQVPATLSFTLAHMAASDLPAINEFVDGTARFECDTGLTYQITNAFVTKPCEISDGAVAVEMNGSAATEE